MNLSIQLSVLLVFLLLSSVLTLLALLLSVLSGALLFAILLFDLESTLLNLCLVKQSFLACSPDMCIFLQINCSETISDFSLIKSMRGHSHLESFHGLTALPDELGNEVFGFSELFCVFAMLVEVSQLHTDDKVL